MKTIQLRTENLPRFGVLINASALEIDRLKKLQFEGGIRRFYLNISDRFVERKYSKTALYSFIGKVFPNTAPEKLMS